MTYPKRLIEVDLPIARISAHARREKSIRHGHISTLHIWWARRPLAACRAVICAALWPDPADPLCPQSFRDAAAKHLLAFARRVVPSMDSKISAESKVLQKTVSPESLARWESFLKPDVPPLDPTDAEHQNVLRFALLDFIADFANWDNSTVPAYLEASRALTQAAHEALGGVPGTRPLVVDPFAGGGSIPLEALRVGADAFASDLNPVAVLLNKVVLEYIPKYGKRLADEVRKWGQWVREQAEKELAEFYPCLPAGRPKDPDGATPSKYYAYVLRCADGSLYKGHTDNLARRFKQHERGEVDWTKPRRPVDLIHYEEFDTRDEAVEREKYLKSGVGREWLAKKFPKETPIAYLWARTIQCEGPGCGAEVPLIRSLWLAKKKTNSHALKLLPNPKAKRVDFEILNSPKAKDVGEGTVARGSATCPCCGYTTPVTSVREQLKKRRGGAADARMTAVVTVQRAAKGRSYRLPRDSDRVAVEGAKVRLRREENAAKRNGRLTCVPDEPISNNELRRISVPIYGMTTWGDLFTPRQQLSLSILSRLISEAGRQIEDPFVEPVQTLLALAFGRVADLANALCGWKLDVQCPTHLFARQAIGMVWDFSESVCLSESSGSWHVMVDRLANVLAAIGSDWSVGHAEIATATACPLPDDAASALITDPPYYDAVPYSHLSDFFYVWMRRTLGGCHSGLLGTPCVPKNDEIVVDRPHHLSDSDKDVNFYERELRRAFGDGRRIVQPSGVGTVVFASKTTASWEAILDALLKAGWTITGSWPIDTEMETRVAAHGQARLGSSIHLVCRPRENPDGSLREQVGEWRDVLAELPKRIHEWMPRLASEGVVGADAIFACLGPALEIFSRYSRVEKASGEVVPLREYLEHVWAAVSTEALSMIFQDADAAGLEPDARLTAMWLWTLGAGTGKAATNGNGKTAGPASEEDEEATDDDEEETGRAATGGGFTLEFDAARKIAQGLGIHLEKSDGFVEVKGDKARLLPVADRAGRLFGKESLTAPKKRRKKPRQRSLFEEIELAEAAADATAEIGKLTAGATVLDRVHQAMLLFGAGRGEALKAFLLDNAVGSDARFWRLAQSLSALYPPSTDEKRWVDGVLARKKGLGL